VKERAHDLIVEGGLNGGQNAFSDGS